MEGESQPSAASSGPSRTDSRRRFLFRLISLGMALGVATMLSGVAEMALRSRQRSIQTSDSMDPVLVKHDEQLGWRLAPMASGQHRHHDFTATYRIGPLGFRHSPDGPASSDAPLHTFVGDSFTFGLGVEDRQTFTALLQEQAGSKARFLNCGVPGFSTDQESILIESDILKLHPKVVWVVVCLANDFIDNTRPYPLQVNHGKPFFELVDGQLILKNVPVPLRSKPQGWDSGDMMVTVLGPGYVEGSWRRRMERRSVLIRGFGEWFLPPPDLGPLLAAATRPSVDLFYALARRIEKQVRDSGAELRWVLLPGRTWVVAHSSESAQYQEFLRITLRDRLVGAGGRVVDLGPVFSKAHSAGSSKPLFFPHDGHLTPFGHRAVAEFLIENL